MLVLGDGTRRTIAAIGAGGAALHAVLMAGVVVLAGIRGNGERIPGAVVLALVLVCIAIALGGSRAGPVSPVTRVLFLVLAFFTALTMLAIASEAGGIDSLQIALVWAAFVLSEAAMLVGLSVLALVKAPPRQKPAAEYDGGWSDR